MEKDKIFEIGIQIGEIVGTHCNDEQIKVFEEALEDYKIKNQVVYAMAEVICKLDTFNNYNSWENNVQQVIQYFVDKVKEQK